MIASFFCYLLIPSAPVAAGGSLSDAIDLYQKKDYKNAAHSFRALAQGNQAATAHYYMGLCYAAMGYQPQARQIFARLVQLWPHSQEASLAKTYLAGAGQSAATSTTPAVTTGTASSVGAVQSASDKASSELANKLLEQLSAKPAPITFAEWQALPQKTRIPIQREKGHLWVNAKINGHYCKIIFDTGFTITTLSTKDFPDMASKEALAAAPTALLGRVYGVVPVKVLKAEVSVQDITRNIRTDFINEKNCSALGQNFFKEYNYQVDDYYLRLTKAPYQGDDQVATTGNAPTNLAAKQAQTKANDKYSLIFDKDNDTMLVDIEVNGHPTKATFDTGCAPDGIVINPSMRSELGISYKPMAERVVLGHMILMNVKVSYASGINHILIGPKIFNRPYTVDQQAKRIRFDY